MTLGQKIKKYRLLKKMTQKELGIAVGFPASSADSRIRKYEGDIMTPKENMRAKIADALDVDLSALSDVDIADEEDVMHALFLLEELFGMDIEVQDGKTTLIFENNNEKYNNLITYINMWGAVKQAYIRETSTDKQKRDYAIWKSKAFKNIRKYFSEKEEAVLLRYRALIEQEKDKEQHISTASELASLIRDLIDAGFFVTTTSRNPDFTESASGFTFIVDELLSPPTEEAAKLFAKYLNTMDRYRNYGNEVCLEMHMPGNKLLATWFATSDVFHKAKELADSYLQLKQNGRANDYILDYYGEIYDQNSRNTLSIY